MKLIFFCFDCVQNWIINFRTWISHFGEWIADDRVKARLKKRIWDWLIYTLLLSFLPIIANLIIGGFFKYDFTLSNIANCYLSACGLSIVVYRDFIGREDSLSSFAKFMLLSVCFVSALIIGVLCKMQGGNETLDDKEIAENLERFCLFVLLSPTAIIGIFMQIRIEYSSFQPHREES